MTIHVRAGAGYDVMIGAGIVSGGLGIIARRASPEGRRAFLVHDAALPHDLVRAVSTALTSSGFTPLATSINAKESEKSLPVVERLVTAMTAARLERNEPVIALGGGLTGDVAGFAAAIYRRGTPVIQCPTTLLAMVDASVGGKTGVNVRISDAAGGLKKNMVGAFHQPAAVLADILTINSLPDREFRAGLAECVKHGMLSADWKDPDLFQWTETNLPSILNRDAMTLTALVHRNVAVKAAVVGQDERELDESGGRAILNLGHTFGHAIETIETLTPDGDPARAPLLHGEAVGLGLIAACGTSVARSLIQPEYASRVGAILRRIGLPVAVRGLPANNELVDLMQHDKKVTAGSLRLVLPTGIGRAAITRSVEPSAIEAGLNAIRA